MSVAATYDSTISASTEITFNSNTDQIEVVAIDKGVFVKMGTADVSSSDFDYFVPANTSKVIKIGDNTAANFIQESATAKLVVIEN